MITFDVKVRTANKVRCFELNAVSAMAALCAVLARTSVPVGITVTPRQVQQ